MDMKLFLFMAFLLLSSSLLYITYQNSNVKSLNEVTPSTPVSFSIFFPQGMINHQPDRFTQVQKYLINHGFSIYYSSPMQYLMTVTGTASSVERLFNIKLLMANSSLGNYYYPSSPLVMPSQLSGLRVFGLSNISIFSPQYIALARVNQSGFFPADIPRSIPFPSMGSLQFAATYYSPSVFQQAYNETPLFQQGFKGQGQTIAVIDAYGDPTIYQDLQSFDKMFNLPAAQLQIIPIGNYQPEQGIGTGWDVETALDVEAVHMMAPYAKIVLLVANGNNINNGLFDAIDKVVTEHLANVTTMSWGAPENLYGASGFFASGYDNYPFSEFYFALGSSEGISFLASSGDFGANGGTPSKYGGVIYPSSSPFVTSVGGTTLFVNTVSGDVRSNALIKYAGETAWSSSPQYLGATVSSGGGVSTFFSKPFYQNTSSSYREVPDISADANPYTGALIVYEGQEVAIGGTSLSSPIVAGMASLLDQSLNRELGLLNPYLYKINGFNKVTFGYNNGYYAGSSYNMVTGLGSPNLGIIEQSISSVNSLTINVSTYSPSSNYPQYSYGNSFQIKANIAMPDGSKVTSGSFNAYIYGSTGLIASVPLSYNGISWVASYTPKQTDPPNAWQIIVSGSSGSYSGFGYSSIDVGLGINIISPIPYPYAPPLTPGQSIVVDAIITNPDGSAVTSGKFEAYFYQNGILYYSAPLYPVANNGSFEGIVNLTGRQGTFIMVVNGTSGMQKGYAYTYQYVGEAILDAAIITPIDQALPTAMPNQTITLIAATLTSNSTGLFDSNVSASFISSSGNTLATLQLYPSPSTTQFGILNLFGFHQANFTIPSYFTPGFYTIVFTSSYQSNSGIVQLGYYNTSIYISSAGLGINYSTPEIAVEGQTLNIKASIYYQNGTEVNRGVFMASVNPSALDYAQNLVAVQTGVPMQFNAASGLWEASYTLPTEFDQGFYKGVPTYTLAGGWTVSIAGESAEALQASQSSYFTVLPYTMLDISKIDASNVNQLKLGTYSSGSLYLKNVATDSLTISGMKVYIDSSLLKAIKIVNSTAIISDSEISGLTSINSNITFTSDVFRDSYAGIISNSSFIYVSDSQFRNLTYAVVPNYSSIFIQNSSVSYFDVSNISSIAKPKLTPLIILVQKGVKALSLNIQGSQVNVQSVKLNGNDENFSIAQHGNNSLTLSFPFESQSLPDGIYQLQILLTSGLNYQYNLTIVNQYHQYQYQSILTILIAISLILAIAAIAIALTRRSRTSIAIQPTT
jgi:subtilase family serine protease